MAAGLAGVAFAGLSMPRAVQAATPTWDANVVGNWNVALNWSTDTVPTTATSDYAQINNGGTARVTDAQSVTRLALGAANNTTTNTLEILPGGALSILGTTQNTVSLVTQGNAVGIVNMTGGSLYSVALFDVGRTGVGSLTMSGGATLTSDVSVRAGILESNGQGTINLIDGTITAGNGSTGGNVELNLVATVATAQTRAPFGKLFQSGGTINIKPGVNASGTPQGGSMNVGGINGSATNGADGEALYEMSGGTLNADGMRIHGNIGTQTPTPVLATATLKVTNAAADINLVNRFGIGGNAFVEAVPGTVMTFSGVTGAPEGKAYPLNTPTPIPATPPYNGLELYHANYMDISRASQVAGLSNVTQVYAGGPLGVNPIGNYEVGGADSGPVIGGFTNNFDYAGVSIGDGSTVGNMRLVDLIDNNTAGAEALYADVVNVTAGSLLDLNGLNVYCMSGTIAGTVNNTAATPATLGVGVNDQSSTFAGTFQNTGGGALTLRKVGTGMLTLSGANTHTGGTTVSAGTLIVAHGDALAGGAIDVADGALAKAQTSLPKAVTITTLTTNTSGKFDLTNNSMVIKGMTDSAVRTKLQGGYNAGAWNGPTGIVSTAITAETSIGYATQAQTGITDFKGVTGLAGTDVLVKFTYAGDANLDGKVDIGDLGLLAGAWQAASGKVWFDGDFTYDGAVDIGDLGLLSGNWQKGTAGNPNPPLMDFATAMAQFSAFDGVVVPEPASLSLLALGGLAALARRCRRVQQS